jgi:hypothetical protein
MTFCFLILILFGPKFRDGFLKFEFSCYEEISQRILELHKRDTDHQRTSWKG